MSSELLDKFLDELQKNPEIESADKGFETLANGIFIEIFYKGNGKTPAIDTKYTNKNTTLTLKIYRRKLGNEKSKYLFMFKPTTEKYEIRDVGNVERSNK